MNKLKIENYIKKFNLGGTVEKVKLSVKDKILSTKFRSDDKTLIGTVTMTGFDFKDSEFGIFDTTKLMTLLGVLGDDIELNLLSQDDIPVSLKLSDKVTVVNYMLADMSVISTVPNLKSVPDYGVVIPLSKDFTTKFIKAKSALSEVDTFAIKESKKGMDIIIGYSSINSNRISLEVETEKGKDKLSKPLYFSAKYLKEILVANSGAKDAKLNISEKGLIYMEFVENEYTSTYYLVEVDTGN